MKIKIFILKILLIIPDKIFSSILFLFKLNYIPKFKNPRSFNEKINYIKLYSNYKLRELVADRVKVRDYVKSKNTACNLINLLWQGKDFSYDVYNNLPSKFVVKANHGSGMVKVVDKNEITYDQLIKDIKWWLKFDYGKLTRQWVYKNLEKKYIVEEFINSGFNDIPDYKFFCINGKVELVQVDLDRFHEHKRNLYTRNFELLDAELFYKKGYHIEKPILFSKAVEIAERLSEDFDFIRVDLYILDNAIYFGELTNTPGNGFEFFKPRKFDFDLGDKIKFIKEFS